MLTQEQQQKLIGALLKKPQNALCADCSSKSPCWASLDFGVFVCMNCSGAHRSLGQSVTRIKSTKLDTWNKDWLWHMQLNNKIINEYFQDSLNPVLHKKPTASSSLNDIKKFVNDKYVRRLFAKSGQDDPITNLKNGKPIMKTSPPSQGNKKQPSNQPKKQQTKSINNTPQISINKLKKNDNLLDDVSNSSNRVPSQRNQKVRQQINIFDEEPNSASIVRNNNNLHTHSIYNKQHFNSFSGVGATHSSTGTINFNDIFNHGNQTQNNQNKVNFDIFNTLTNTTPSTNNQNILNAPIHSLPSNNHHHYAHIHQHNLPHMNIHSSGVGTGFGHHPHQHHQQSFPTHVTMNINMNMYSNVMNINLKDDPLNLNSNSAPSKNSNTGANLSDNMIKLDISDFKQSPKLQPQKQKTKSWVDDWK